MGVLPGRDRRSEIGARTGIGAATARCPEIVGCAKLLFGSRQCRCPREIGAVLAPRTGRVGVEPIATDQHLDAFGSQVLHGSPERLPVAQCRIREWQYHHRNVSPQAFADDVEGVGVGDTGRQLRDRVRRGWGDDHRVGRWCGAARLSGGAVLRTHRLAGQLRERVGVDESQRHQRRADRR